MANATGIDVSNHNGTVSWGGWRDLNFAFAKATEGTGYRDPTFGRNWAGMASVGLVRGAYAFAHPGNDPAADAGYFLDYARLFGISRRDLLCIDLEVTDGLPPSQVAAFARAWCQRVKSAYPANQLVVYTYLSFAWAGNCAGLGGYPLWIADPDSPAGSPRVPLPWSRWHFHQYATTGGTDRDVFGGSLAALKTFASGTAPAWPAPIAWEEPPVIEVTRPDGGTDRYVLAADGHAYQAQYTAAGLFSRSHLLPGSWKAMLRADWSDIDGDGQLEAWFEGLGLDGAGYRVTWGPGDPGWQGPVPLP